MDDEPGRHSLINSYTSFLLVLVFFFTALILILLLIFYFVYWAPTNPAPFCQVNADCAVNQVCQINQCVESLCQNNGQCTGVCTNNYCYAYACLSSQDCPNGLACLNQTCQPINQTCQDNTDCGDLTCFNGRCVQCTASEACPTGQACVNNLCQYPEPGQTGLTGMILYSSKAQMAGNIAAPPGYFCAVASCGATGSTSQPHTCSANTPCPGSCPYCIAGQCRCTAGQIFESCLDNTDCLSGLCQNSVCVPSGGQCLYSYNQAQLQGQPNLQGMCLASLPYCVNGTCAKTSEGAMCGASYSPADMCNNPASLGAVGATGQNGMGFFCVNGYCQNRPGQLNQLCSAGSCEFLAANQFICANVQRHQQWQARCTVVN